MTVVLDASALLAYLLGETGGDEVGDLLRRAAKISAVNYAEALARLAEDGETVDELADRFEQQGLVGGLIEVEPVMPQDARVIATLQRPTRHLGLSLGDRTCLALAVRLELPVVTADRAWAELGLDVAVQTIR